MGYSLVLVGRSLEKGNSAVAEMKSFMGNGSIQFYCDDLSSMKAGSRLCDEIKSTYNTLDILINNAGAYFSEFWQTKEGFAQTFALNHQAYFSLTQLLLEMVTDGTPGRIVNVASGAHRGARLNFNDIQGMNDYKGWPAYCRSKLCNIMFTYECHQRYEHTNVTFNCLLPGFVNSNFGNNNSGMAKNILEFAKTVFAVDVAAGASTSSYLASSEDVQSVSGGYFVKCRPEKSSEFPLIEKVQNRLWEISEGVLSSLEFN